MKGIIIYGSSEGAMTSYELKNVYGSQEFTSCLKGEVLEESKVKCSPDDTYDFETGALIALMKMCGVDKVVRACNEAFSEDTFKTYATMYERELNILKKNYNERLKENSNLSYIRDLLINKNNELIEENKNLKADKDKSWKNYQRNIQKKQDRINELEGYNAQLEDEVKNVRDAHDMCEHKYQDLKAKKVDLVYANYKLKVENEKLQHEYDLCLNSENALKITTQMQDKSIKKLTKAIDGYKNDLYKVSKRCTELEAKEAILNKEEELSVYFGGRQNGKQYTFLVDLFKKIDQKKVDAAYKEAYNTEIPVWQKEFFKHMYDFTVYRKTEPIKHNDQLDSLLEASKYAIPYLQKINPDKPLTRREHKWDRIFKLHKVNDVIIEVKKEDVTTFLHEIEDKIPEITWASDVKIFEAEGTIKDIYGALKSCDRIYFRLRKDNELSYSSDPDIYQYKDLEHISYLPPMRWDLFKKGRLAVKVTYDNYKEFYEACEKELGKRPSCMFTGDFTVSICKDDGFFEIFTVEDQKKTGRKIVDWEDVR